MNRTVTLTKTGQITVPKWVREILGIEPGERLIFRKGKNAVVLEKEKAAAEIAENIDALIPEEVRKRHMQHYKGMTAAEMQNKWVTSTDGLKYLRAETEKTL